MLRYHSPQDIRFFVESHLLAENRRRFTSSIGGIVVVGTILAFVLHDQASSEDVAIWLAAVALTLVLRMRYARYFDTAILNASSLNQMIRRNAVHYALSGLVWGAGIVWFGPQLDGNHMVLLAIVMAGFMGSMSVSVGPVPLSANLFQGFIALGIVISIEMRDSEMTFSVVGLTLVYFLFNARAVRDRKRVQTLALQQELANEEALDTVSLLLRDFEANSSDWLWHLNPDHTVEQPSPRFIEAAGGSCANALSHTRLPDLFAENEARAMLERALDKRTPFRDLDVTLRTDIGGDRIWRLSGKPWSNGSFRGVARDVTKEALAERAVSFLANHDSLTGLGNRHAFCAKMEARIAADVRGDAGAAIMLIDLDRFKQINDTLGHPIGDEVLKEVAQRILGALAAGDYAARLGGDEFAVLLDGTTSGAAERTAERLMDLLAPPAIVAGMPVVAGASIGLARLADNISSEEAMRRVDLALYEAKLSGRGTYRIWDSDMRARAQSRALLEARIAEAIERSEFTLHYQPLVDLGSYALTGFEGLLRWEDPVEGMVLPNQFIAVAEETGQIMKLGEIALQMGIRALSEWPKEVTLSLNLSVIQLRQQGLAETILALSREYGVDLGRLELEITETVMMVNDDVTVQCMHELKALGLRLAVDDFGTGFSSISYLRDFPFDRIKIDRSFVASIDTSPRDRAIIRSISQFGRALGVNITVEGIERIEQLDALKRISCDTGQGYLFSRPVAEGRAKQLALGIDEIHSPYVADTRRVA